jgi:hypothetical protein
MCLTAHASPPMSVPIPPSPGCCHTVGACQKAEYDLCRYLAVIVWYAWLCAARMTATPPQATSHHAVWHTWYVFHLQARSVALRSLHTRCVSHVQVPQIVWLWLQMPRASRLTGRCLATHKAAWRELALLYPDTPSKWAAPSLPQACKWTSHSLVIARWPFG